jgi:hypothetical protein
MQGVHMLNFVVGIILGITVATVGFSGVSNLLDRGVDSTKTIIKENVR